jgi:hypothetical protein
MAESFAELMGNWKPPKNSAAGRFARSKGVTRCPEFDRIAALPRREAPQDLRFELTNYFKTPGGTQDLRLLQAYGLTDLYDFGGLFGMVPVGGGKTLLAFLAGSVLRAERPVILVPANLLKKTVDHDLPFYRQHWRLPDNIVVLSYSKLSSEKQAEILYDLMPDLIVCDEVHHLRSKKAARTRRFVRYFSQYPNTRLAALSGTMTKRSLKDYWHIIKLCLPRQCPLPLHWPKLEDWADAIDADIPEENRVPAGALLEFCAPGENVRQGFRRRLVETPGVIASTQSAFGDEPEPGIEVFEVDPGPAPKEIVDAFRALRETWKTPSGDEISDGMSLWRHACSLAQGFFLRWVWPCSVHAECSTLCSERIPDVEWLNARSAWRRKVRETLKNNRRGLDSELQVFNACARGEYEFEEFWPWERLKDRYGASGPRTEAVWVSDWLIHDVVRRANSLGSKKLIIWVRNPDIGERIAYALGVPFFGTGKTGDGIITHQGMCVASVRVHGTGKNLQFFDTNLFVGLPSGGTEWQQVMGRTHRPGQQSDVVRYFAYLHCKEAMKGFYQAQRDADYIEDTTGDPQKLKKATVSVSKTLADLEHLEGGPDPLWR